MSARGGFVAAPADHEIDELFGEIEIPGYTEPEWKLSVALTALLRGHRVIPCDGKRPLTRRGYRDATDSAADVYEWWTHLYPAADVGVVVSADEIVLDIDPRNGGDRSLARLEEALGPLPSTFTVLTGGTDGGRHLYFRFPEGPRPEKVAHPRGVDIRTASGYVIAAGSRHHESGNYYRVDPDSTDREPAELPIEWLRAIYDSEPYGVSASSTRSRKRAASKTVDVDALPVTGSLSIDGRAMIRTGVKEYGDSSPSGVFWSCLWFCSWAGLSEGAVLALAADSTNIGLHREYLTRGRVHVQSQYRYVRKLRAERGDGTGLTRVDTAFTEELDLVLDTLVTDGVFRGAGSSYEVIALRYAISKIRSTTPEFTLSHRELEGVIGSEYRKTAVRVLERLVRKGHLLPGAVTRYGRRYTLTGPLLAARPEPLMPPPHDTPGVSLRKPQVHEAFTGDPTGARIAGALPGTAAEVITRTGISASTVYRNLRKLHGEGTVERTGRTYSLALDLDVLARSRGFSGAAKRRANRHELERRLHREAVVAWHERKKAELATAPGVEVVDDVVVDLRTGEVLTSSSPEVAITDLGTLHAVLSAPMTGVFLTRLEKIPA